MEVETDKISEKPTSDPSPTDNDVDSKDDIEKHLQPHRKVYVSLRKARQPEVVLKVVQRQQDLTINLFSAPCLQFIFFMSFGVMVYYL